MSFGKQTSALIAGSIVAALAVALGSSSVVAANFHKQAVAANRGHVAESRHHWQPHPYGYDRPMLWITQRGEMRRTIGSNQF
jgi:hypothetical protein